MEAPVIGIDLGTTFSCVAVFKGNKPHVIELKDGSKTMASVVAYTDSGRIVGNAAKENFRLDPRSTISGVKRFIGRQYSDLNAVDIKKYPIEIIDENDSPRFQVEFRGEEHCFSPEEVSATILDQLKACAEQYLDMEVRKVVIAVPAHFNDAQRQATVDAGRIAGLEVLRIINEPTAAAFAYGINEKYKNQKKSCNILVYDFGGGTFDVSIINIDDGIFEVKATTGDTQLGGDDIDHLIVSHFVNKFERKYNTSLEYQSRALRRLRVQSEKIKKTLSNTTRASIDIPELIPNCNLEDYMTSSEFDEICKPFIDKTIHLVEEALTCAGMKTLDIDEVVLVGGTTRLPKVHEALQKLFNGKQLNFSLNPDEAIAIGACVQAGILDKGNSDSEVLGSLLLLDVNSLSLGVETLGGIMSVIIPRNTQIPTEKNKYYTTTTDNQRNVKVIVYEGERRSVYENTRLGEFTLRGIRPAPRGTPEIFVTFALDTDGILKVTAVEKTNNITNSMDIDMQKYGLSDDQIRQMIENANKYRKSDEEWEQNINAKLGLEFYCTNTLQFVNFHSKKVTEEQRSKVTQKCNEVSEWLSNHATESKHTYEEKRKELYNVCNPILKLFC